MELDEKITLSENKVLLFQARVQKKLDAVNQVIRRLEREAKDLAEMKNQWIEKRNAEDQRVKLEARELSAAQRHAIEDLRVKYEVEKQNKLRDLKMAILEKENEINEWRLKRDEAAMKTRTEEAKIKAKFQVQINSLLREEQCASRRGVVRQKRLLDLPNVFSMTLDTRNSGLKMKRQSNQRRRDQ